MNVPLTLSQILANHNRLHDVDAGLMLAEPLSGHATVPCDLHDRLRAEREWFGAIATLNHLLLHHSRQARSTPQTKPQPLGIVISGDAPVLTDPQLSPYFPAWVFTPRPPDVQACFPPQLPFVGTDIPYHPIQVLPLLPDDPLTLEQFCLVFSDVFCLALVLGQNAQGDPAFQFSFDPIVLDDMYQALHWRMLVTAADQAAQVETWVDRFAPQVPDVNLVTQFSHLMLRHLPEPMPSRRDLSRREPWPTKPDEATWVATRSAEQTPKPSDLHPSGSPAPSPDVELLQAIAHEVRTPLATIRTLTRLALKQKDLPTMVIKRLQAIDQECSEQIDRFGLIFQAVELETASAKSPLMSLSPTPLDQVLRQSIPRWQQQAQRSSLTLDVALPQYMPNVVSNPALLDQVLTSLVERFTHQLPHGSNIRVIASLAGSQLKLQLESDTPRHSHENETAPTKTALKSIGNLLMFQPETGNLSLNLAVTKNLFHALGGKLIARERAHHGEVLTIFLPLDMGGSEVYEV